MSNVSSLSFVSPIWSESEVKTLFKHIEETNSLKTASKRWNSSIISAILPFKSVELCQKDFAQLQKLYTYNSQTESLIKLEEKVQQVAQPLILEHENVQDIKYKRKWSSEEDEILLNFIHKQQKTSFSHVQLCWEGIEELLPNRTIVSCKRRFYIIQNKKTPQKTLRKPFASSIEEIKMVSHEHLHPHFTRLKNRKGPYDRPSSNSSSSSKTSLSIQSASAPAEFTTPVGNLFSQASSEESHESFNTFLPTPKLDTLESSIPTGASENDFIFDFDSAQELNQQFYQYLSTNSPSSIFSEVVIIPASKEEQQTTTSSFFQDLPPSDYILEKSLIPTLTSGAALNPLLSEMDLEEISNFFRCYNEDSTHNLKIK
jgi:hypothetical protein